MKLLFDHNLSPRLANRLGDLYPNSNHLFNLKLDTVDDSVVWKYAREHEFIIVTKDSDFSELSVIKGFPPKVIWIRTHSEEINKFGHESNLGILILS
jgi:predicted nuclease of predicted toxin-antitoxin system